MARNYFISDVGYEFSKFFYFYETKIIQLQGDDLRYVVEIGLKNDNSEVKLCIDGENISDPESDDDVGVCINYDKNDKEGVVDIEGLTLKEGDFLGCGIVFPPRSNSEESPFVFFTHNKKQIGKGIVVDKGSSNFRPFICLKSASVDTNFGCDMENCFNFNVLLFQHFVSNEYYSEEDFEKEEMEED
uniref:SPRY domain-containing protein n=1 Tax=Meloidogyne hapla TaxID=6305 RepID=A0A1I8C0U5_MELHA